MTLESARSSDRVVHRLWRTHDFLADELRERRSRAASLFGVAALSLVTLLAAALTTSIADIGAVFGWFPVSFEAVLAFSAFVAAVALVATNPGLPWERGSIESVGYFLSRLLRVPATGLQAADPFERAPGYRHFLGQSLAELPLKATVASADKVSAEDLALQIRARSLQLNQLRVWRRPLTVLIGLDLLATSSATLVVVSFRLGIPTVPALVGIGLGVGLGVATLVSAASFRRRRGPSRGSTRVRQAAPEGGETDPLDGSFFGSALVGGLLAAGFFVAAYVLRAPPTPEAATILQTGLLLTGLLFVPASIFVPVVGAMFPTYWNATPVGLIRLAPLRSLLSVLVGTITYGVVATLLGLLPPLQGMTWVSAFPMVLAVSAGAYRAAQLVAFSLSVFDPIWLADWLASESGAAGGDQSFADLCRLLRGMIKRERRTVAVHIIGLMAAMAEAADGGAELHRDLALRVLREADAKWTGRDIHEASAACRQSLEELAQSVASAPAAPPS